MNRRCPEATGGAAAVDGCAPSDQGGRWEGDGDYVSLGISYLDKIRRSILSTLSSEDLGSNPHRANLNRLFHFVVFLLSQRLAKS